MNPVVRRKKSKNLRKKINYENSKKHVLFLKCLKKYFIYCTFLSSLFSSAMLFRIEYEDNIKCIICLYYIIIDYNANVVVQLKLKRYTLQELFKFFFDKYCLQKVILVVFLLKNVENRLGGILKIGVFRNKPFKYIDFLTN